MGSRPQCYTAEVQTGEPTTDDEATEVPEEPLSPDDCVTSDNTNNMPVLESSKDEVTNVSPSPNSNIVANISVEVGTSKAAADVLSLFGDRENPINLIDDDLSNHIDILNMIDQPRQMVAV